MKTIKATNQVFQYLYSVVKDAKMNTIEKVRTAKEILIKDFGIVNEYELQKQEPIERVKKIDEQIQLIFNAGKQTEKIEEIKELNEKRKAILDDEIKPMSDAAATLDLEETEIEFTLNEMKEFLNETAKFNTMEEMEMFDALFTALESAE